MTKLSPTKRLEYLLTQEYIANAHETIRKLLNQYEAFLTATDAAEPEMIKRFLDPVVAKEHLDSANVLGDLTFQALELIGQKNSFHRMLTV